MTLEEQLAADFPRLARMLDCELTIYTKHRGTYAVFFPRACLGVENGKLWLGHPAGAKLYFERAEIAGFMSGVSILPAYPGVAYQRVVEHF